MRHSLSPIRSVGVVLVNSIDPTSALVLFSGGQDSTVCLAWALERFDRVETLGFDYEQRHRAELEARQRVRERITALDRTWAEKLGEDHLLHLRALAAMSDTTLPHEIGGDALVDVLVEDTHTCYLGDRSRRHDWGYGCGTCPACRLRAQGFAKWMPTR